MTDDLQSQAPTPVTGYWAGEHLERVWRFTYRPEFVPLLLQHLGARSGMRILDVGCGTGFLSRLIARNVEDVRVIGIDSDDELLAFGRQKLEMEGLGDRVEYRKGDAYKIPFPDGSFDLATSHTVF